MISDRDISSSIWNRYMKKYGKKYRIFRDEQGIWSLKCKFGLVQPFSIKNKELVFIGTFRSSQHLTFFKKKLEGFCKITQEGVDDTCVMFPENKIDLMSNPLKIYKKKQISAEQREQLRYRMKKVREMRKVGKNESGVNKTV